MSTVKTRFSSDDRDVQRALKDMKNGTGRLRTEQQRLSRESARAGRDALGRFAKTKHGIDAATLSTTRLKTETAATGRVSVRMNRDAVKGLKLQQRALRNIPPRNLFRLRLSHRPISQRSRKRRSTVRRSMGLHHKPECLRSSPHCSPMRRRGSRVLHYQIGRWSDESRPASQPSTATRQRGWHLPRQLVQESLRFRKGSTTTHQRGAAQE